jgi:chromosome segregation ATPase
MVTKVASAPDPSVIFPRTTREKHCSFEDWFRYIGVGASLIGAGWCFTNDLKIPGYMALVSGAMIIVSHITDKTCGARARLIEAAKAQFQGLLAALGETDIAAKALAEANKDWTRKDAQAKEELELLRKENTDLEKGEHAVATDAQQLRTENQSLREAVAHFQERTKTQATQIESLQREVDQFKAQNVQFQNLLTKGAALIPQFAQTEKEVEGHIQTTTGELQQNVNQFTTQLRQMEAFVGAFEQMEGEIAQLRETIVQLKQQTEAFSQATGDLNTNVAGLEAAQQREKELRRGFSDLEKRFGADKDSLNETTRKLEEELQHLASSQENGS